MCMQVDEFEWNLDLLDDFIAGANVVDLDAATSSPVLFVAPRAPAQLLQQRDQAVRFFRCALPVLYRFGGGHNCSMYVEWGAMPKAN